MSVGSGSRDGPGRRAMIARTFWRGIIGCVARRLAICLALTLLLCSCGVSPTVPSTLPLSHESATARRSNAPQTEARESGGGGSRRHRRRGPRGSQASRDSGGAEAGKFDFYVMSLSWSPGFCATAAGRNDPLQCGPGSRFAFVLHGLWPQYERGGWPQNCSTEAADESLVNSMLTIMPSPRLVAHEWQKHGTCSGLSPKDYFEEATEAFNSVKIPARYQAPRQQITVSPDQLRRELCRCQSEVPRSGTRRAVQRQWALPAGGAGVPDAGVRGPAVQPGCAARRLQVQSDHHAPVAVIPHYKAGIPLEGSRPQSGAPTGPARGGGRGPSNDAATHAVPERFPAPGCMWRPSAAPLPDDAGFGPRSGRPALPMMAPMNTPFGLRVMPPIAAPAPAPAPIAAAVRCKGW